MERPSQKASTCRGQPNDGDRLPRESTSVKSKLMAGWLISQVAILGLQSDKTSSTRRIYAGKFASDQCRKGVSDPSDKGRHRGSKEQTAQHHCVAFVDTLFRTQWFWSRPEHLKTSVRVSKLEVSQKGARHTALCEIELHARYWRSNICKKQYIIQDGSSTTYTDTDSSCSNTSIQHTATYGLCLDGLPVTAKRLPPY